jgi:hypothetical protein
LDGPSRQSGNAEKEGQIMSEETKKWRRLTEKELWHLADKHIPGAEQAERQVRRVKEARQKVAIYYSETNGFQLDDENPRE